MIATAFVAALSALFAHTTRVRYLMAESRRLQRLVYEAHRRNNPRPKFSWVLFTDEEVLLLSVKDRPQTRSENQHDVP